MEIFPFILTRLGGNPFDQLRFPEEESLKIGVAEFIEFERAINFKMVTLSEELLNFNRTISDSKIRNLIQNLRRDIFNGKKIKPETIIMLEDVLPISLFEKLSNYINEAYKGKELIKLKFYVNYEKGLSDVRASFKLKSINETLRKGLVLSSHALLNEISAFQKSDRYTKKELNLESSIYKYLTRIAAKTTPYSTFNNLAITNLVNSEKIFWSEVKVGKQPATKSKVQLNNFLFKYLKDLLLSIPEVFEQTKLTKNPTLVRENDEYLFLVNVDNVESFQRIAIDEIIDLIINLIDSTQEITISRIIEELVNQIDEPREEIRVYLESLVQIGFLEVLIPISGQDPNWSFKLMKYLKSEFDTKHDYIEHLKAGLNTIQKKIKQYSAGNTKLRLIVLKDIYEVFVDCSRKLHDAAGIEFREHSFEPKVEAVSENNGLLANQKALDFENDPYEFKHIRRLNFYFKIENILLEDTSKDVKIGIDKKRMKKLVEKLDSLCLHIPELDQKSEEREEINRFFISKYGLNGKIPALTLYEDFYREIKIPEEELERKNKHTNANEQTKVPLVQEVHEQYRKYRNEWLTEVRNKIKPRVSAEIQYFNLLLTDLVDINFKGPLPNLKAPVSLGIFAQTFIDHSNSNAELKMVINNYFAGYGKLYGRFLHLFPKYLVNEIRSWNKNLINNEIYAENCDASYFNANLHPSIFDYEIKTPGSNNMLSGRNTIEISNVFAIFNKNENRVNLIDQLSGFKINVFDLGIQAIRGRSKIYQLLDKFNPVNDVNYPLLLTAINSLSVEATGAVYGLESCDIQKMPRITFENDIIIQRKKWIIPSALVPKRQPMSCDADYFLQVNKWINENGIDNEVFININPFRKNITEAKKNSLSRDDRKPQYINFSNPISVRLFEKIQSKDYQLLQIEEMLPGSSQLLNINKESFVNEFVLQWYRYKNK